MLGGVTTKIASGLGIALLVVSGSFYWYYKNSQNTIATLNRNVATLESNNNILKGTIQEQNQSIQRLETRRESDQETILRLSNDFNKAREEVADLRETFSRHDLENLSLNKPGLIERIINKGTAEVGRELEELTAIPEKEKQQ